MKKFLKVIGLLLGGVALLVVAFLGWAFAVTGKKLRRTVDIPPVVFARDLKTADLVKGRHLVNVRLGCVDCHGNDLAGGTIIEDPAAGHVYGSNITPAALKEWTDGEVARAIRHGVSRDGRPLLIMPSHDLQHLSEEDLANVVAYLRTVAPVEKASRPSRLGPVMKVLYALGKVPTVTPVDVIDHAKPAGPPVKDEISPAFGEYVAKTSCMGCHNPKLTGGKIPGGPPNWPVASNIAKDALGTWSEADFIKTLRTGVNPAGDKLRFPMVTTYTAQYTDTELKALWVYIQSLPSAYDWSDPAGN